MDIRAEQMTVERYAAVQTALGNRVEKAGQVYWSQVKGLFCRPLLPYVAYAPSETKVPRAAWGGFQHVVPHQQDANSCMDFLMLNDLQGYEPGSLSHNRRRLINNAAKLMEVRTVRDVQELQEQGYSAYSSFYGRTGYKYLSSRRRKAKFNRWAETLLREPKTLVLGAYGSGGLVALSVCYWVEETLLYTTHFSHTTGLRQGASELLFHVLRLVASQTTGIHQVFVRNYRGGNGMDQYYLLRGANLVRKPAQLQLQPAMKWVLKCFLPRKYAVLRGTADAPL